MSARAKQVKPSDYNDCDWYSDSVVTVANIVYLMIMVAIVNIVNNPWIAVI